MKYENYSVEDFLADKKLIDWVKNPNEESNLFWSRWIKEHRDQRQILLDAIYLIRSIHFKEEEVSHDEIIEGLDRIISHSRIHIDTPTSTVWREGNKQKYLQKNVYKIAASVILFLSFAFTISLFDWPQDFFLAEQPVIIKKNNPKGQKSTFVLPDSTVVVLNAESTLSYPEHFQGTARKVELTGEAYFDVYKNAQKPFIVKSGSIHTKALGTSFNIKAFESEETISVSLSSGKVVVKNEDLETHNKVLLVPGEKYVYNTQNKKNTKTNFDVRDDLAWKDGILYFKQSDLDEFISTIERWYAVDVTVVGTPGGAWKINGRFNKENLHNVLESLSFARQIRYTLEGKSVVLYF